MPPSNADRHDAEAQYEQLRQVLDTLADPASPLIAHSRSAIHPVIDLWARNPLPLSPPLLSLWQQAYRQVAPESVERRRLLRLLAEAGDQDSLRLWCQAICASPPATTQMAAELFAPLFRRRPPAVAALFPDLLSGLAHPTLAPLILDLSNYLTRQRIVASHPAAARQAQITGLLSELADRLNLLQQRVQGGGGDMQTARQISESVALAVGCCDALGLIGSPSAAGALHKALSVPHRRIQAEAACALARLDQPAGRQALVELARDPVIRTRVLAYAEELGMYGEIPAEYRTEERQAEGQLVAYLAEPFQWGAPPANCRLIDHRRLRWPGYDQPIDCFLWQYTYRQAPADYTNMALVGPGIHAPRANLTDLPPVDVYALLAGMETEHTEIRQMPADRLDPRQRTLAERLVQRAEQQGQAVETLHMVGELFGLNYVTVSARRGNLTGTLIIDDRQMHWFPDAPPYAELDLPQRHAIFIGRELLRAFNPAQEGA
jgi:hypothetical protein